MSGPRTRGASAGRSVLRLVDANANRAIEGVRVCEEVVRLHFEWPGLFRRLRALRHDIADAVHALPVSAAELVRARASDRDIGRAARSSRSGSLEQIALINFQRAKEAIRMLEECARLVAPRAAGRFQALRFRIYALERELVTAMARNHGR